MSQDNILANELCCAAESNDNNLATGTNVSPGYEPRLNLLVHNSHTSNSSEIIVTAATGGNYLYGQLAMESKDRLDSNQKTFTSVIFAMQQI